MYHTPNVDLAPTILSLAGVEPGRAVGGQPLLPLAGVRTDLAARLAVLRDCSGASCR